MDNKNFNSKNMSIFVNNDEIPSSSFVDKMAIKDLFSVELMNSYLIPTGQKSYIASRGYLSQPSIEETSLERIERKLDHLVKEVATRDDIIMHTETLLHNQEKMNNELQEKLEILRSMQMANLPHKRLTKSALAFVLFFAFSFICDQLFGVTIVTRFWTNIGLLFSFCFFLMGQAMAKDWLGLVGSKDKK